MPASPICPRIYKTDGRTTGFSRRSAWWAFNRVATIAAHRWGDMRKRRGRGPRSAAGEVPGRPGEVADNAAELFREDPAKARAFLTRQSQHACRKQPKPTGTSAIRSGPSTTSSGDGGCGRGRTDGRSLCGCRRFLGRDRRRVAVFTDADGIGDAGEGLAFLVGGHGQHGAQGVAEPTDAAFGNALRSQLALDAAQRLDTIALAVVSANMGASRVAVTTRMYLYITLPRTVRPWLLSATPIQLVEPLETHRGDFLAQRGAVSGGVSLDPFFDRLHGGEQSRTPG